jgi:hypothetical protein
VERKEQNRAKQAWDDLKVAIDRLDPFVTTVLLRATYSHGMRKDVKIPKGQREHGTPPPAWNDPTGETAIRHEDHDAGELMIVAMADNIHRALNIAQSVIAITPVDVAERAERTVPDCLACGDPCHGGVRKGFDDKCRKRWERIGRPERGEFIAMVRRERSQS